MVFTGEDRSYAENQGSATWKKISGRAIEDRHGNLYDTFFTQFIDGMISVQRRQRQQRLSVLVVMINMFLTLAQGNG